MNEWMTEWMNDRMNEWMNEWMTEWMNEWMNETECMDKKNKSYHVAQSDPSVWNAILYTSLLCPSYGKIQTKTTFAKKLAEILTICKIML